MTAGIGNVPALFRSEDQTPAQIIETKARLLVAEAEALGCVLTIGLQSVPPLAMGRYAPVIQVREKR